MEKNLHKGLILLLLIFFIAVFLRFFALGNFPPTLHRDEAFLGYNAYSILHTGREMTGDFLPVHFRSFLFSPGLYSYAAIPFIALWGLSAFTVRFPAALFGSLTILGIYFLVKEVLRDSPKKEVLALLSSLFLALLPWHISLSRVATENVIVTFLLVVGVWLYLVWMRKSQWHLFILAFLSFFTTLFLYQATRAFLPLFLPVFFIVSFPKLHWKKFLLSMGVFLIAVVLPVSLILLSPQLSLRIKTLSLIQNGSGQLVLNEQFHQEAGHTPIGVTRVFHNKLFSFTDAFLENYFAHFSYDFLFTDKGLPDRYRVPLTGLLYIWELPLILVGLLGGVRMKKNLYPFFAWLLLAPVGSALTFDDVPNLQRTLFMVIPLCLLLALGTMTLFEYGYKFAFKKYIYGGIFFLLCLYGLSHYWLQYTVHMPQYRPWYRQDGYKKLVEKVTTLQSPYKKVVITDRESAPTIFFLFYTKYSPALFQRETANTTMHDFDRINFGDYEFSQEECPLQKKMRDDGAMYLTGEAGVLYIDSGLCTIPKEIHVVDSVYRADNSKVFSLVDLPQ